MQTTPQPTETHSSGSDSLGTVLERLKTAIEEKGFNQVSQSLPEKPSSNLPDKLDSSTTKALSAPEKQDSSVRAKRLDSSEKVELLTYISQCFDCLNTYGKTPDQLTNAGRMFIAVLSPYPMLEIKKAFVEWARRNSAIPTPADILNIIDPPPPTPDWAAYVAIRQKMRDGYTFVMPDQRRYVAWCEDYAVNKLKSYEEREKAKQDIQDIESKIAITDQRGEV